MMVYLGWNTKGRSFIFLQSLGSLSSQSLFLFKALQVLYSAVPNTVSKACYICMKNEFYQAFFSLLCIKAHMQFPFKNIFLWYSIVWERNCAFFVTWPQTTEENWQHICPFPVVASTCGIVHIETEEGFFLKPAYEIRTDLLQPMLQA